MILLFDMFVCRKSCHKYDSVMQPCFNAVVHSQAAPKDQATDKADAVFEAYKDASDDSIGPEGQNLAPIIKVRHACTWVAS